MLPCLKTIDWKIDQNVFLRYTKVIESSCSVHVVNHTHTHTHSSVWWMDSWTHVSCWTVKKQDFNLKTLPPPPKIDNRVSKINTIVLFLLQLMYHTFIIHNTVTNFFLYRARVVAKLTTCAKSPYHCYTGEGWSISGASLGLPTQAWI
jgi:hypothetical protein